MHPFDLKFAHWTSRLLDLGRRNRLLYFKPLRRSQVRVLEPEPGAILNALLKGDHKLTFARSRSAPVATAEAQDTSTRVAATVEESHGRTRRSAKPRPVDNYDWESPNLELTDGEEESSAPNELLTDLSGAELGLTLYQLRSRARTAMEEQGVNVLFAAFGMLHWSDPLAPREEIQSPLLLLPVQLDRSSLTRPYTLEALDDQPVVNPTLAYKLQKDLALALPPAPEDADVIDLGAWFDAVRAAVREQNGWSVSPDVYTSLFSFEKLVMVQDLEEHDEQVKAHPLLRAFAGDVNALDPIAADLPKAQELDALLAPADTFQVLDADSSQQEAIAWATRGASFVIQGPPGTGKSQTIANIIAEFMAQNKNVLFVSAKLAALEIVYRRLEECGLGSFCLQLHSQRAGKNTIVANLGRALNETPSSEPGPLDSLNRVAKLRERLNRYAAALHSPVFPLDRTPFQVHGELAALASAPDLTFKLDNIDKVGARTLSEMVEQIEMLVSVPDIWEHYDEHPWRGVRVAEFGLQTKVEIGYQIGSLIEWFTRLEASGAKLASRLGLHAPQTPGQSEWLLFVAQQAQQSPCPPSEWFRAGRTDELRAMALAARTSYEAYHQQRTELLSQYDEALLELPDLNELEARFQVEYSRPTRWLDNNYRNDHRRVQETARGDRRIRFEEARAALEQARGVQARRVELEAQAAEYRQDFGSMFKGIDTDWNAVLRTLDWVDALTQPGPSTLTEQCISILCNRPNRVKQAAPLIAELQARLEITHNEINELTGRLALESAAWSDLTFAALKQELQEQLNHIDDLEPWLQFQGVWQELERLGLRSFLRSARAARLDADQLKPAFLKRFYQLWLDAVAAQDPILHLNAAKRTQTIEQFCRYDVEQLHLARQRIVAQQCDLRASMLSDRALATQLAVLRRELAKRKRQKSLRRLFSEIPNLLLTLKPCLMMSPLSVSQFLSAAPFVFDLVIFDEASQIPPEEAAAAIFRSKQVIVVGDSQQLPPTPFFHSLGLDPDAEYDDAAAEPLESLLQESSVVLPWVSLTWHYRSRHESLLAFSNDNFYENRLTTFPQVRRQDETSGVEFVYVPEGVYDRAGARTNAVEAARVVELILAHFGEFPARSLGVVTFSQAQRDEIDRQLQQRLAADPKLEHYLSAGGREPFFIKSLENVQGDERDVILLSIGYGKDADGVLTLNFGPLNGEDGARRLNVAITRARFQVKVVSSILPEQLELGRIQGKGLRLLRAYLVYARRGGLSELARGLKQPHAALEGQEALMEAVAGALSKRGLAVESNVGTSEYRMDLAVIDPADATRYAVGIPLDGTNYRLGKTARDRERLRRQVLEQLGWKIEPLWSQDWVANPDAQTERLMRAIKPAGAQEDTTSLPLEMTHEEESYGDAEEPRAGMEDDEEAIPNIPELSPYQPVQLPRQGTPEQFYLTSPERFEELLVLLVKEDAPIHIEPAARRIAACWGITRVSPAVEEQILGALGALVARGEIELRGDFLWRPGQTESGIRIPRRGESPRPIQEMPDEEIAQAGELILRYQPDITPDELVAKTADLLGYHVADETVTRRVRLALNRFFPEAPPLPEFTGEDELAPDEDG